jgi:hypothetical protein
VLLFVCALASPASAQERYAEVIVDGGERLVGKVIEMDLDHLSLEVAGGVLQLDAARLRSCRFATLEELEREAAEQAALRAQQVAETEAAAEVSREPAEAPRSRLPWRGPLQDPVDPSDPNSVPVDQRHRLHLTPRIEALDRAYPWLAPAAPPQWISLGLLLLVGSGLLVHLSVHIAGADRPRLGRSVGLGLYYLVTALAQVAFVPVSDFSVSVMVLLNGSLSLFLLSQLFGLTRGQSIVAQAMQLGFGVGVFAALELVTSLLGTVGFVS